MQIWARITRIASSETARISNGSVTVEPTIKTPSPRLFDLGNRPDAKTVQDALSELGFYTGAPDGIWGVGSKFALQKFKASNMNGQDNSIWDLETQKLLLALAKSK